MCGDSRFNLRHNCSSLPGTKSNTLARPHTQPRCSECNQRPISSPLTFSPPQLCGSETEWVRGSSASVGGTKNKKLERRQTTLHNIKIKALMRLQTHARCCWAASWSGLARDKAQTRLQLRILFLIIFIKSTFCCSQSRGFAAKLIIQRCKLTLLFLEGV